MIWWLKANRLLWLIGTPLVAAILCALLTDFGIAFPSLGSASPFASIRLYAILPLAGALAVAHSLDAGQRPGYISASRRTAGLDYAINLTPIIITCLVSVPMTALGSTIAPELIRNIFGFIGLQMIAAPFFGSRTQSFVPVAYVFIAALFGRDSGAVATFWAWPLGNTDLKYWYLPLFIFVLGSSAQFTLNARKLATDD
ncbi:MAG: hypothetical protein HIU81_07280 [Acidobacteria bacterium]|nr:hypothetical protein [Acidobacteriota bacterium]